MANIIQMMKKAKQFKSGMADMQARVHEMEVDGAAAGGLVTCRMSGSFELTSLKIQPSLAKSGEIDVLEDLVLAAVNDARIKAATLMKAETQVLMDDIGLPADFADQLPI